MSITSVNTNDIVDNNTETSDYRPYLNTDNYLSYKEFAKGNLPRKRLKNINEIIVKHTLTDDSIHRKKLANQHHYALTRERLQKKLEEKRENVVID